MAEYHEALVEKLLAVFRVDHTRVQLAELLDTALDGVIELTRARYGCLLLARNGVLVCMAARDAGGGALEDAESRISRTIVQRCLETGETIYIPIVAESPAGEVPSLNVQRTASLVCIPIRRGGQVLGVLYVDQAEGAGGLRPIDRDVLLLFGEGCGIAIANAGAYTRLVEQLEQQEDPTSFCGLVGQAPAMQEVFRRMARIARSGFDPPVLIGGESGTGKELVARGLHLLSARRDGPFIPLNCAAIPGELFESQLFGHRRGAFTGATEDRPGLFAAARGGTLFLDEIGELDLGLQAKLLRVLQDKVVSPVGSTERTPVDVWVLSATHQDLAALIGAGRFREDLYYRLYTTAIELPPLRERLEDLPLLIDRLSEAHPLRIDGEAERLLRRHTWPGNVRELQQLLQHLQIFAEGDTVRALDLPPALREGAAGEPLDSEGLEAFMASRTLDELRGAAVAAAVRRQLAARLAEGAAAPRLNKSGLARQLGVSRNTIPSLLEQYGVDPEVILEALRREAPRTPPPSP